MAKKKAIEIQPRVIDEAMVRARFKAIHSFVPYYATAILSMNVIPPPDTGNFCPTMGVDKYWRLYYNREFLNSLSPTEAATIIWHEVEHLLREHHRRFDFVGCDKQIANIAMDCEINDDIKEFGGQFPVIDGKPSGMFPDTFGLPKNLLAEEYYALLMQQKDDPKSPLNQLGGGKGEDDQNPSGFGGSSADGQQRSWEIGTPKGNGEDSDHGITPAEAQLIARNAAESAKDYYSRNPGKKPAGIERWYNALLTPKKDWKREFKLHVKNGIGMIKGNQKETYAKFNRRSTGKIVLPSRYSTVPRVAVAIDTSGSMCSGDIDRAMTEFNQILKDTHCKVLLIAGDTEAAAVKECVSVKDAQLVGGGGTDMGALIDFADQHKFKPNVIVVLTDGDTPWTQREPKAKTIVGLTRQNSNSVPMWAKTVDLFD